MMKKMRKVSMEPSSSSYPMAGEEARGRFRLQSLSQDYEDLVKETEAMRKRLDTRKQQKLELSAQVKFLRRKYKFFLKNPPQISQYPPKLQSQKTRPIQAKNHSQRSPPSFAVEPQNPAIGNEFPVKRGSYREKESSIPSTSAVLDLNQVSMPNGDEEEFQVAWEPLRMEKPLKQYPPEADPTPSDIKLSVCRDVGNGTSGTGKRKISWQDQVALRV